jgi:hypothetical protein
VSYITGAHAVKVGFNGLSGYQETYLYNQDSPVSYRFNNGVPNQITLQLTPYTIKTNLDQDLGLFAQDRWTLNRLTLNGGVRFDYFKTSYPEMHVGPVPLAPSLNLTIRATTGVAGWKDITPKMAAAYDVFGNGKTALKITLNKYVAGQALSNGIFGQDQNPISRLVVTTTRSWNDANRNFVPDCDLTNPALNGECGAFGNNKFGQQNFTTTYDPATLGGWGRRNFNWEFSTSVQHAILPRVSVDAGYFRRWYGNMVITDNRAVSASDYTSYTITAPSDPRLPGGGSYRLSGLYDLNPNQVGNVDNLVTFADNYGNQIEHWNGVDLTVNARLQHGVLVQGGLSTGRTTTDTCDVVAKVPEMLVGLNAANVLTPQAYCRQQTPFLTQLKLLGTATIPRADVLVSATVQSLSGPAINANFTATNAIVAPALGRNLSGNAANVVVNLVQPGTLYGERLNQLDVRVGKILRVNRTRTALNLDIYNVFNASTVLAQSDAFATWQRPQSILTARFAKISVQFDF